MKMMVNMLLGNKGTLGQVKTKGLVTVLAGYIFYFLLFLRGARKTYILGRCSVRFEGSSVHLWEQGRKRFSTLTMTLIWIYNAFLETQAFFIFCHWDFLLQRFFIYFLDLLWTKSLIIMFSIWRYLLVKHSSCKNNIVRVLLCLFIENDD